MLLLLSLPLRGQSQAPFRGGAGDGYAKATVASPVSVEDGLLAQLRLSGNRVVAGTPLELHWPAGTAGEMVLLNAAGQRVGQWHAPPGAREPFRLPTDALSPGIYLLQVTIAARSRSWRVQILSQS